MTKSEIFSHAHKRAKQIRRPLESYRAAFSRALSDTYTAVKNKTITSNTKAKKAKKGKKIEVRIDVIRTLAQIEKILYVDLYRLITDRVSANMKRDMIFHSNRLVNEKIDSINKEINRMKKIEGAKEQALRGLYAEKASLSLQIIK